MTTISLAGAGREYIPSYYARLLIDGEVGKGVSVGYLCQCADENALEDFQCGGEGVDWFRFGRRGEGLERFGEHGWPRGIGLSRRGYLR